jgi:hypothetical protein
MLVGVTEQGEGKRLCGFNATQMAISSCTMGWTAGTARSLGGKQEPDCPPLAVAKQRHHVLQFSKLGGVELD